MSKSGRKPVWTETVKCYVTESTNNSWEKLRTETVSKGAIARYAIHEFLEDEFMADAVRTRLASWGAATVCSRIFVTPHMHHTLAERAESYAFTVGKLTDRILHLCIPFIDPSDEFNIIEFARTESEIAREQVV